MQIYLFNYSPIQTVIFILLPWILNHVEDDSIIIAKLVPYLIREHVVLVAIQWRGGHYKLSTVNCKLQTNRRQLTAISHPYFAF